MAYEPDLRRLGHHTQQYSGWYSSTTQHPGLHVPDSVPSHGSSPQSSNGSLLGTPYQTSGNIAEIGDVPYGSSRFHHDGSPMSLSTPTNPVNGLGLVLSEPRKSSPLGGIYGAGSNGLAISVDFQQEGQNHHDVTHWDDTNMGYQTGAGSSYDSYNQTPTRSQSQYHTRSYSDNGSAEILPSSTTHFSSGGGSFGSHRNIPAPINRSNSLPPLMPVSYYPPSTLAQQWNNSQNNYAPVSANYQNAGIPSADEDSFKQWLSPPQTHEELNSSPSPTNNQSESAGAPLFQARVGSDRTRAISRSRRTNPDKKLFACDIPGCGATITSKHNFKSMPQELSLWNQTPYM
ncbi:hypothetical protein D9756_003342 [Leucocoprinus leucothites]|uniref:Uncharacterized protein n=1 Tax=Leucocoprinus leucothites TaxID=201217 RepID=A0A8H5G7M7_9AGAR|nr:hypothetical protein D9756_003342 [Leucoagaricus leucothites]